MGSLNLGWVIPDAKGTGINVEQLDKAVRLLSLAQEHGLVLARNGDKLKMSQAVKHDDPDLDIIFRTLAARKQDVLAIMEDAQAIRQWLHKTQTQLVNLHTKLNDVMDQWVNVEQMYITLHPDSKGCVCAPDLCRDDAVVRCDYCARKEHNDSAIKGDQGSLTDF